MKNNSTLKPYIMTIGMLTSMFSSTQLFAHGYMLQPESRAYACKLQTNYQCGSIIWEPQSLEGTNNFPQSGPANGKIASAGLAQFSELNSQSQTRWVKRRMPTGENNFTWEFTAPHVTKGWRYFITKPNWNPNAPLTRQSFELRPFCTADGLYQRPQSRVTHRCSIPSDRKGYHVILAVWDIGDTTNSFYNVIDVHLGEGFPALPTPPKPPVSTQHESHWKNIGEINPVDDLKPNDRVKLRVFEQSGENLNLQTQLTIQSAHQGQKTYWTHALAQKINQEHSALRAGTKDHHGNIQPALGKNNVYITPHSTIVRTEVTIERANSATRANSSVPSSAYQYAYPQNIQRYKAGTKVLGSDGQLYQCKPYPYSGWCGISSHHYVPGTGSNWRDAWNRIN
jgi:N-acetylglucosamine-binding protein A